jgi:tetratricopeptide (TPR) repeat protein|tara:strand:+ start:2667 stop:3344 length:678 start_codon:yes stop_codon:yes gene_type:complete
MRLIGWLTTFVGDTTIARVDYDALVGSMQFDMVNVGSSGSFDRCRSLTRLLHKDVARREYWRWFMPDPGFESMEALDEVITVDPTNPAIYYQRGDLHGRMGEHQQAIQDYNEAIRLNPDFADAYNARGVSHARLGENRRAVQDYDEAIRLDPANALAHFNRGTFYNASGQDHLAIKDLDEAIRLNPKYALPPCFFVSDALLTPFPLSQRSYIFDACYQFCDDLCI